MRGDLEDDAEEEDAREAALDAVNVPDLEACADCDATPDTDGSIVMLGDELALRVIAADADTDDEGADEGDVSAEAVELAEEEAGAERDVDRDEDAQPDTERDPDVVALALREAVLDAVRSGDEDAEADDVGDVETRALELTLVVVVGLTDDSSDDDDEGVLDGQCNEEGDAVETGVAVEDEDAVPTLLAVPVTQTDTDADVQTLCEPVALPEAAADNVSPPDCVAEAHALRRTEREELAVGHGDVVAFGDTDSEGGTEGEADADEHLLPVDETEGDREEDVVFRVLELTDVDADIEEEGDADGLLDALAVIEAELDKVRAAVTENEGDEVPEALPDPVSLSCSEALVVGQVVGDLDARGDRVVLNVRDGDTVIDGDVVLLLDASDDALVAGEELEQALAVAQRVTRLVTDAETHDDRRVDKELKGEGETNAVSDSCVLDVGWGEMDAVSDSCELDVSWGEMDGAEDAVGVQTTDSVGVTLKV